MRRVREAVDARAESARDIHEQLNLYRFVRLVTFQHWVTARRRDRDARSVRTWGCGDAGTEQAVISVPGSPDSAGSPAEASSVSDSPSGGSAADPRPLAGSTPDPQTGTAGARPQQPTSPQRVDLVIAQCVEAIASSVAARRIGKLDVGRALRSLAVLKELSIAEAAEKRVQEIHEVKLAELRRKQAVALEEVSQATGLTDEQLGQIKSRVLGL